MHFALPPRKSSSPPIYTRASARSAADRRRKQLQYVGYLVLTLLTILLFLRWVFTEPSLREDDGTIPEDADILIVTILDENTMSDDYIRIIKANRDDYAARHGYKTFYTNTSTYSHLTHSSPTSWSLIPAIRHALTTHPEVDYIWSLSPDAMITNITLSLHTHIFDRLPSIMKKDIPVVPPDSVIHTFSHLKPSQAYMIMTQDIDNLSPTSFILRNSLNMPRSHDKPKDSWTHFLLDAWFDPLYRAYAFQKAENHALEHIVQWHPTILAKLVIIDQRLLNSYNFQPPVVKIAETGELRTHDSMWQKGDLAVNFKGCAESAERDCEREMREFLRFWIDVVEREDGKRVDLKLDSMQYTPDPARKEKALKVANQAKKGWEEKTTHL